MKSEELNDLMVDVTSQLNEAGCEYFLSVMTKDEEATLGSASLNMNDIDAAAEMITQSILRGGGYGQRMFALFGKVMYSLPFEQDALKGLSAAELMARFREFHEEGSFRSIRR